MTIDCAGLCLKSGNASILRGGKEAIHSNQAMASIISEALKDSPLPDDAVQLIPTTDREALNHLLTLDDYLHCIIPRGGEGLIRFVAENSQVPVIKHYKGVCNLFVDATANLTMAKEIAVSSKCGRPGVCNAIENLIVEKSIAAKFLPDCAKELIEKAALSSLTMRLQLYSVGWTSPQLEIKNMLRNSSIFALQLKLLNQWMRAFPSLTNLEAVIVNQLLQNPKKMPVSFSMA